MPRCDLVRTAGTALVELGLNPQAVSVLTVAWKLAGEQQQAADFCLISSKLGESFQSSPRVEKFSFQISNTAGSLISVVFVQRKTE